MPTKPREAKTAPSPALPLSALLSQILVAYTIEFDNEFEQRMSESGCPGSNLSLGVWSNVMRFISEAGITVNELAAKSSARPTALNFNWVVSKDGTSSFYSLTPRTIVPAEPVANCATAGAAAAAFAANGLSVPLKRAARRSKSGLLGSI